MADIKEVKEIKEYLVWIKAEMSKAINRWIENVGNCKYAMSHMSSGILRNLCENPRQLNPKILDPLIKWLDNYMLNREGKLQIPNIDTFLLRGLRLIYQFTVVADHFIKNPRYFYPDPPIRDLKAYSAAQREQNKYKELIIILTEKLIGCNKNLSFLFLDLSKTIKKLPEDMKRIQDYLDQECLFLRTRKLELR